MPAEHIGDIAAVDARGAHAHQHLIVSGTRRWQLDELQVRELAGALEAKRLHRRYFCAAAANAS
jgi:hypothetical protein